MTSVKAIYQETPESEIREWDLDYGNVTVGEVMDIERLTDKTRGEFEADLRKDSQTAMLVLLYVIRKRAEPELTFSSFREMKYHRLSVVVEHDAPAGGDEGKVEDPSDEGPTPPTA